MRVLELFAGAGGAALGLEAAGFEHAGLVELDSDACQTLRAAGLGPVIESDVRDLDAVEAVAGNRFDLLWSSFPCQAWSTAGGRQGAKDDRNGWPWTVAALDRFRPTWFLGENVKGLQQHNKHCTARGGQRQLFDQRPELSCAGCYLERVILPELRARYRHAGVWLLDAADLGVAQHRRRVILWAGPNKLKRPKQTHGPGAALPWVSMASALGLEPSERVIGGGMNPKLGETRRYRDLTKEPSTTVAAVQIGNAGPWVCPAPTVTTTEVKGTRASAASGFTFNGGPDRASDALFMMTGKRRLTVAECATLQDFPKGYPFQGTQTARYRQVGNAVPPTLARVVAERLAAQHDSKRRGQP